MVSIIDQLLPYITSINIILKDSSLLSIQIKLLQNSSATLINYKTIFEVTVVGFKEVMCEQ